MILPLSFWSRKSRVMAVNVRMFTESKHVDEEKALFAGKSSK